MLQQIETESNILDAVITGATGFLGSSLAASILMAGGSVVALTRDDSTNGHAHGRTLNAIKTAAKGFEFQLHDGFEDRLFIIETSLENLSELGVCPSLLKSFSFWHCAADMRYGYDNIEESLNINLIKTSELYQYFSSVENCKRFYYISTAYTVGFNTSLAEEALHLNPKLINAYQTSKWSAEMSLALSAQRHSLPVTLFRPSIICGHTRTGWTGNRKFGLYGVLSAISFATRLKSRSLTLAIETLSQPNYIPIDEVIKLALILQSSHKDRQQLEVIHATAMDSLMSSQVRNIINDLWGTVIQFGMPEDRFSQRINRSIEPNLPFLNHVWQFAQSHIIDNLDPSYTPFSMNEDIMRNIIQKFYTPGEKTEGAEVIPFG